MVRSQHQDVLLRLQANQDSTQQRRTGEIKRTAHLLADQLGQLPDTITLVQSGQIGKLHHGWCGRLHALNHRVLLLHHDRAQRLMPLHHLPERGLQGRPVQRAPEGQRARFVEGRGGVGIQLLRQPDLLLGIGQREGPLRSHRNHRRGQEATFPHGVEGPLEGFDQAAHILLGVRGGKETGPPLPYMDA